MGADSPDACSRRYVALIDLRMPEMSGIEAIAAIRERIPAAQAILLSTYSGDEDVYQSLRAGAKAYLLKDAPREELSNCIRAMHEGKTLYTQRP